MASVENMPRPACGGPAARTVATLGVALAVMLAVALAVAVGLPVSQPESAAAVSPVGGDLLGSTAVVVAAGAPALPAKVTASSWLIADAGSGAVLAARNPHGRFAPASTLKILTAVTLLPRLDPRRTMVVTNADETVDGTKVGLVPGLRLSIDQLFTALLVVSANDAANVLARAAGGQAATVGAMGAEARRLHALDTVPRTVHGLDAKGQTSSAYDLALLGRAGLALPAFRRYVTIRRAPIPAPHGKSFEIDTHNRLLGSYPGTIGVKNGHTAAAGSSLVAAARRGGRTVLVTLMHADPTMWRQAAALLDWGFRADGQVAAVGTLVPPLPGLGSQPAGTGARPGTGAQPGTHSAPGGLPPSRPGAAGRGGVPASGWAVGGAVALLLAAAGLLRLRHRT